MEVQDFPWNLDIFWFWVEKALIWALFYYYFVQSAETVIFGAEIDSRGDFFAFFTKFWRIFIFDESFMLFSEEMHLRTYGLGNDFLGNHQTTVGFLAKNADFGVLGLKLTKFGDFHEKLVFAAQITIFRPPSPTINNS